MKVLVTGAAGFIGANIVRVLEAKNAKVLALDNFSYANYKNLIGTKSEVICADICEENTFKKLPKIDAVINAAAITDTTFKDDTKMMMVNFEGFRNALNYCLKNKIKLVYVSSAATYGDGPSPMKEDQTPRPLNIYGYSKYMCDCLMRQVTQKQKTPLIVGLRYFNVFGPYEFHKGLAASITYQLYCQMKAGKRPRVFKYGEQKRDFIYVKDVARITVGALDLKKNTILNVGTGVARSFNDIIAALNKSLKTNYEPDYFDNPYSSFYQNHTEADVTQLNKLKLGAKYSLEDAIEDYVNGFLEKK